jgi:hypothetical protein
VPQGGHLCLDSWLGWHSLQPVRWVRSCFL